MAISPGIGSQNLIAFLDSKKPDRTTWATAMKTYSPPSMIAGSRACSYIQPVPTPDHHVPDKPALCGRPGQLRLGVGLSGDGRDLKWPNQ